MAYKYGIFLSVLIILSWLEESVSEPCICRGNNFVHFWTFNEGRVDFHGDCRYTLVEVKDQTDFCYFHVVADNYRPYAAGGRSRTQAIDVIAGPAAERIRITMSDNGLLKVNEWEAAAPMIFDMPNKGKAVVIQTGLGLMFRWPDCNLVVRVDKDVNSKIELDTIMWRNNVRGICGTCNGVQDDYFLKDGGTVVGLEPHFRSRAIADSYVVNDFVVSQFRQCGSTPLNPTCGDIETQIKYRSQEYCGLIRNTLGVFGPCIKVLDDEIVTYLFEECRQDVCSLIVDPAGQKTAACNVLSIEAQLCAEKGVAVNFRTNAFCPLQCPAGSTYNSYMTACPPTCGNPLTNSLLVCTGLAQTEGCVCNGGLIAESGRTYCVQNPSGCGCTMIGENAGSPSGQRYFTKYGFFIKGQTTEVLICGEGGVAVHFTNHIPCVSSLEKCYLDSYGGFGYCGCPSGYRYSARGSCGGDIDCPLGSQYTLGVSTCKATCKNPDAGTGAGCTTTSNKGCECNDGFLWDEDTETCVTKDKCGCFDSNGNRVNVGHVWLSRDCSEEKRCVLTNDGLTKETSTPFSCPDNAYCDVALPQCVCLKYFLPVNHDNKECKYPIPCFADAHYSPTASPCPATCANPDAPSTCTKPTYHGCVCKTGYYFTDDSATACEKCTCTDSSGNTHNSDEVSWNAGCTELSKCEIQAGSLTYVSEAKTCGLHAHCDTSSSPTCVCDNGYLDVDDTNSGDDCAPKFICGVNSVYSDAATTCPNSCTQPTNSASCSDTVASCECTSGHVLSDVGGACIPLAECDCTTSESFSLGIGEKAFNSECSEIWECVLHIAGPKIQSTSITCGELTECDSVNHACKCLDTYSPVEAANAHLYGGDCRPPIVCDALLKNEIYDSQASACPNTCAERDRESSCAGTSTAACKCLDTHWRKTDAVDAICVLKTECGCQHQDGAITQIGAETVLTNCTKITCGNENGVPVSAIRELECPEYTICDSTDTSNPKCVCINDENTAGASIVYIWVDDPVTGEGYCQRETNICSVSRTQNIVPYDWREDQQKIKRYGDCTWTMMEVTDQTDKCYLSATMKAKTNSISTKWVDHIKVVVGKERHVIILKWGLEMTLNGVPVEFTSDGTYWILLKDDRFAQHTFQHRVILAKDGINLLVKWKDCGDFRINFQQLRNTFPTLFFRHLGLRWANKVWGVCGNGNTNKYDAEYVTHGDQKVNVSNLPLEIRDVYFLKSYELPDPDCKECSQERKDYAAQLKFCGQLSAANGKFATCHSVIGQTQVAKHAETCEYAVCTFYESDLVEMFDSMCEAYDHMNKECEEQAVPINFTPWFCNRCSCQRKLEPRIFRTKAAYSTFDGDDRLITSGDEIVLSERPDDTDPCYYQFKATFQLDKGFYHVRQMTFTLSEKKYVIVVDNTLAFTINGASVTTPSEGHDGSTLKLTSTTTHAYIDYPKCKIKLYSNFIGFVLTMNPTYTMDAFGMCGSCDGDVTND